MPYLPTASWICDQCETVNGGNEEYSRPAAKDPYARLQLRGRGTRDVVFCSESCMRQSILSADNPLFPSGPDQGTLRAQAPSVQDPVSHQ